MIIKNWDNPPAKLRSKLFWAWNDELSSDLIRQQVANLHQMGFGGFFMHSRNGLKTPYLGEKWFDIVRSAAAEAAEHGIQPAIYDEDRWPSGGAGGMIAAADPTLAACELCCKTGGQEPAEVLASADINGIRHYFFARKHPANPWYNNYSYPDVFNPATARLFLELTHEKYLKNLGSFSELNIDEIFMDEPFYGVETFRFNAALPWSNLLPEEYFKRFNENLLPQLPGLFFDLPDNSHIRIRWQFHSLLAELFRENFLRPVSCWCGEHGLKLTGHMFGEDLLASQAGAHGSTMAALQYFQQPGLDYLTNSRCLVSTVKQTSSTARQLGRRERLAEIYGCTGWEFPLYDQRKQGDMLFALGINRHCQHLGWYSARGERKRDFPGSLAWHATHQTEISRLEERFGRLHAVFEESREVRDILLLNPVESAYTLLQHDYENNFTLDSLENSRLSTADALLNSNLDFDYGDEELLARYASAADGKLRVGEAVYRAIVIPETVTLRRSTWELLRKFAADGGSVLFTGMPPHYLEGKPNDEPFYFSCCRADELPEKLAFCRRVSLTGGDCRELPGLLHLLLRHADGYFLFIHNTGYTTAQQADATQWRSVPFELRNNSYPLVQLNFSDSTREPQIWDMDNGSVSGGELSFALAAGESKLLFFPDKSPSPLPPAGVKHGVKPLNNSFAVSFTEDNILLFDRPELAAADGTFYAPVDMRRLDSMLRKTHNMRSRNLPGRQPWADPAAEAPVPVTLRFTFFCDQIPAKPVRFATEDGSAGVFCNDHQLAKCDCFWFDHSLNFFEVKNLRPGINHLIMHTFIDHDNLLENCFLLGDFGVKISGFELHVTAPVKSLNYGDWAIQGLPFYAGAVDYTIQVPPGQNRKLDLDLKGSYAVILENDDRCWHEKSDLCIPDGRNEITLRVYGSRRNSHGPFHIVQDLRYCNPGSFSPVRESFHPHWMLEPYGIFNNKEDL